MRWLPFLICACLALILQSVVAPRMAIGGVRPDLLLVLVVTLALHVRLPEAAVSAWLLGAAADMMTLERAGLISLTYLLVAIAVGCLREYVFRYRALTLFLLTFVFAAMVQMGWLVYRHALYDPSRGIMASMLWDVLGGALYTAVWAPLAHRVILTMPQVLGIPRPRYTYAGLGRLDKGRV